MAPGGPPDTLTPRHRLLAYMVIAGKSNREIALELGYHENRVSIIKSSPMFRALVARLQDELRGATVGGVVDKIINRLGPKAVDRLEEVLDGPEDQGKLLRAIEITLDRNPATARVSKSEEDRTIHIKFPDSVLRRLASALEEDAGRPIGTITAVAAPINGFSTTTNSYVQVQTLDEAIAEAEAEREAPP